MDILELEIPDYAAIKDSFRNELALSAKGVKTSLPFIKNQIKYNLHLVKDKEIFQIFVIGGTSGIIATVQKLQNTPHIISQESVSLKNFFSNIKDFFSFIEAHLNHQVTVIGINFAFGLTPVTNNEILDGIMIGGDEKGHMFANIKKSPLGQQITEYFATKGKSLTVFVVNDAVCLLLNTLIADIDINATAAYIVGTGNNLSFFLTKNIIINTQASDFSSFQQTTSGKIIDMQSTNPGKQVFAKEVAGELYKHFNILCKRLHIKIHPLGSTEDLNNLAYKNEGQVSLLAQKLIQRSACMVAAQIAGFYEFKNKPGKMNIITEGSLFWKGYNYKSCVEEQFKKFNIPKNVIFFKNLKNSDIVGISKLLIG
ncbi:MAG TPA: hypothetical protein VF820_00800 [Patescibacteria group bacterium]